jgi:hypothetical protein
MSNHLTLYGISKHTKSGVNNQRRLLVDDKAADIIGDRLGITKEEGVSSQLSVWKYYSLSVTADENEEVRDAS